MPALEGQFLVLGTCTVAKDKVGLIRWFSVGRVKAQRFDDDLVAVHENDELSCRRAPRCDRMGTLLHDLKDSMSS